MATLLLTDKSRTESNNTGYDHTLHLMPEAKVASSIGEATDFRYK